MLHFRLDAGGIPVIVAITDHLQAVDVIRDQGRHAPGRLRSRRILQTPQPVPVVGTPSSSLMSENMRLIKMKVVNDIRIMQRLLKNQVTVIRPARSGSDDGVRGGTLAD